jgi:hypothetical protein
MNIHSPRYIYNQINLHQKDTKKQLSGASYHLHQTYNQIMKCEACGFVDCKIETSALKRIVGNVVRVFY